MKMDEKLSASGGSTPDSSPGALPLDLTGDSAPRPPFSLVLAAFWQILDPQLLSNTFQDIVLTMLWDACTRTDRYRDV